jgi:dienelactone hydrolase
MRGNTIFLFVVYSVLISGLISGLGRITQAVAGEPAFRLHALNVDSKYPACAALDVNHDGKLDILSGGWWYEAPSWKRHRVREVQTIRGRFDDYSNLPIDVNGDGWLDIVSVNYRSQSLYWVEHPGQDLGTWTRHLIAEPGAMETGRLVDIDGDGQMDLLPNGLKFAAWWEVRANESKPIWIRHDLPNEIAGHGIGSGDINGDGRRDLVGPNGWLEAPVDRRRERWIWHPDFSLDRDCGLPIFVHDVDADGDADLIWGRGHRIGLYWMEQQVATDGTVVWQRHAIDTSWSQPHSLLLADIDRDGRVDLVAGKRYMGHDGKDPGEYDPLVAYWYSFDQGSRTWKRGTISPGGPAGFGLDPKAVDLDMDGDIDIIAPGRNGLFWFENLLVSSSTPTDTTDIVPLKLGVEGDVPPSYSDHADVSIYIDKAGKRHSIESPADLARRRGHILLGMQQAMGQLPSSDRRVPLRIEVIDETETEKYLRRKITFASEPGDRVPAYLLIPKNLTAPSPAMLCLHQTTRSGKDEPAGLSGRATLHYAHELAELGFVCIVPDYPSFGEYPYDFKKQGGHYASGSMKAIWNNHRAIDVLQTMPEVNHDKIGCIGHSLGGHNSLFTAVFDQRIRAVVTSCGFTPFHDYYGGKIAGWTSDRYMPRLRDLYGNDPDRVPFDFYEVLTAIAPRAVFINAPLHDSNFDVAGVKKAVAAVGPVYQLRQASQRLTVRYPDCAHDFPDEVRREAYAWLQEQLRK